MLNCDEDDTYWMEMGKLRLMAAASPDTFPFSPPPNKFTVTSPRNFVVTVKASKVRLFVCGWMGGFTDLLPFLEAFLHFCPFLNLIIYNC